MIPAAPAPLLPPAPGPPLLPASFSMEWRSPNARSAKITAANRGIAHTIRTSSIHHPAKALLPSLPWVVPAGASAQVDYGPLATMAWPLFLRDAARSSTTDAVPFISVLLAPAAISRVFCRLREQGFTASSDLGTSFDKAALFVLQNKHEDYFLTVRRQGPAG